MAKNEAASREINEEAERAHPANPPGSHIQIACECALKTCGRVITITVDEYRNVRMDPRQFAIVPEHLIGDIERIAYENDRFVVVAKREGTPAHVARDENPRG
jgi:23S rRNA-/tRNA-specific pseudouridylate synthase